MIQKHLSVLILMITSATLLFQAIRAADFQPIFAVEHGLTTFRSQIIRANADFLVIPSEGAVAGRRDPLEGVRVYRLADGALVRHLGAKTSVDADQGVRGVLVAGEVAIWGDASGHVSAQNWRTGESLWSARLPADVESAPAWLNAHTAPPASVVFGTTAIGEERRAALVALDLATGAERWRFWADSPGDFMASPLACDVNGDGHDDVVIGNGNNGWQPKPDGGGNYGSSLYALDGKTGKVLWQKRFGSGQHARTVLAHDSLWVTESYGQISRLSLKGDLLSTWSLADEAVGVFATPVFTKGGRLIVGSSTWGQSADALWCFPVLDAALPKDQPASAKYFDRLNGSYRVGTGRISATAVVEGEGAWVVSEDGALMELREAVEGIRIVRVHGLPAGSECPPLILHSQAPGGEAETKVIVAGSDGMLRCFTVSVPPGTSLRKD